MTTVFMTYFWCHIPALLSLPACAQYLEIKQKHIELAELDVATLQL